MNRRAGAWWWYAGLALGTVVRLAVAPYLSNTLDLRLYGLVALDGAFNRTLYHDQLFSYPPLWGYVLHVVGRLWVLTSLEPFSRVPAIAPYVAAGLTSADLTTPLATTLLKGPLFVVDALVLVAMLIACKRLGIPARPARIAGLCWWLNPVVIFGSAINASFDNLIPLSVLCALLWADRRAWFSSGAVLALGIFAKLAPLWIALVVARKALREPDKAGRIAAALLAIAGAAAVSFALLLPVLAWHDLGAMREAVFARAGSFRLGGASLGAFSTLEPFSGVATWAQVRRGSVLLVSDAVIVTGLGVLLELLARVRARSMAVDLRASLFLLALALLVAPFAQPTYVIWLLVPVLVLAARGQRAWRWLAVLLTACAAAFAWGVRSPYDLATPLCVFAHACNARAFGAAGLAYRALPGVFAQNRQAGIDAFAGVAIGLCYVGVLIIAAWQLARTRGEQPEPDAQPADRKLQYALFAAVAGLVALAALPFFASPALQVTHDGNRIVVSSAGYTGTVHAAFVPERAHLGTIAVYLDDRYAWGRGITATFAGGFTGHLRDECEKRNLGATVRTINAGELAAFLRARARGAALVVPGGVLPATVRRAGFDLLAPWIARGGVVVWAAQPFDLLYAAARGSNGVSTIGVDYSPWRSWYAYGSLFPARVDPFTPPVTRGERTVPLWNLARSTFVRTTFAVNTGPLLARGGVPLGFVDRRANSSLSLIPYGKGRIILYADTFDDEIVAAQEVAQVLAVGGWFAPKAVVMTDGRITPRTPPLTLERKAGTTLYLFGDYADDGPFAR